MKIVCNLVAGVVILASILAPVNGQELEAQFASARAAMQAEDWTGAQVIWQSIVTATPENGLAQFGLSQAALKSGDLKTAQMSIAAAVEVDARDEQYRAHAELISAISSSMTKARRLFDENDTEGAVAEYEQLLQRHPYVASAQHALGMAHKRNGDLRAAATAFRAASAVAPDNTTYTRASRNLVAEKYNSANNLYKRRDWASASRGYLEAIDIEPTFHPAYYMLAKAYSNDGDNMAALVTLHKVLVIKPDYVKALVEKGSVLVKEGQTAEAEKSYRMALNFDRDNDDAYVGLGTLLRETDMAAAIAAFTSAIAANAKNSTAHESLGEIYSEQENWSVAQKHLERATQLKPKSYLPAWRLSVVYNSQENFEQARLMAKKSTDLKKSFEYAWYQRGIAEKALGNKQAAIAAFKNAEKGRDSAVRKSAKYELDQLTSNGG